MNIRPGNHQHIGSRKEQQDAFGFSDLTDAAFVRHGGVLAIVADGMGGLAEGGEAARLAVRTFLESYARKLPAETIEDALDRSILEANSAVRAFAAENGLSGNCGTTLVAAVVHESGVYWTHAGDSRLYMTDGQSLTPLTEDHIYVRKLDKAVEKGILEPEDALSHPEREALTSYIGGEEIETVGRGSLRSAPGGLPTDGFLLLLCSDGLYKTLPEERILEAYSPDPEEWARTLVDMTVAEKRLFQDNVTVLCLAAGTPPPRRQRPSIGKKTIAAFTLAALLFLFAGGVLWRVFSRTPPADSPSAAPPANTTIVSGDIPEPPAQPAEEHREPKPSPDERPSSPGVDDRAPAGERHDEQKGEQVFLRRQEGIRTARPPCSEHLRKGEKG